MGDPPKGQGNVRYMPHQTLGRLEDEILKIPGVISAFIEGKDAPSEVHIVAESARPPKQIVRDVQSLAAAAFGVRIDHRKVSIVRLEEKASEVADTHRPLLDRVVLVNRSDGVSVQVGLMWPDGMKTEGAAVAGTDRPSRAKAAAHALAQALQPVLTTLNLGLVVEDVVLQEIKGKDAVLTHGTLHDEKGPIPLLGSALVHDDVATAAAKALLHSINRQLR